MTDNEIIKALECCGILGTYVCDEKCPMFNNGIKNISACRRELNCSALTLINRQKAEIDRLKINLKAVLDERADHTEAIKEFAERLKGKKRVVFTAVNDSSYAVTVENINNLVKEMVGDDNA